jgi:Zn-dependent protease
MLSTGRRYRVLEVRGIPLYVGTSWLVIVGLYLYGEYLRLSGVTDAREAVMLAALSAVLFFGGVLAHEVAHAIVARAFDVPVSGITLVFWGGATEARANAKGPWIELLIAAAGPLSTLALAGVFTLIAGAMDPGLGREVMRELAFLNLLFAGFNALPGFPLDGGRVVMAAAWAISRRRRLALQVAGWSGVIVGAAMLILGFQRLIDGRNPAWGIWLGFVGFTLFGVGRQMPRRVELRDQLEGAIVADAMRPPPEPVPGSASLSEALDHGLREHPGRTFPVTEAGRVVGTISMDSARRVGARDPLRPVREAMRPLATSVVLSPDEPLDDALEWLAGRQALVLRDGVTVGALTVDDVEAWYEGGRQPAGAVPPRPDL